MDFSLLNAGLAAGAAMAAVPVLLHLLQRQKPQPVIFPALQLIRKRYQESTRRRRIKNWLLLLLRALLFALLALALARPAFNTRISITDESVPSALALVFVTSLWMLYTVRGQDRVVAAKQRAIDLLGSAPEQSQIYVIDSAEPGLPPPLSPAAATDRIKALELREVNRPLNDAVGFAYLAVAESEQPRREVYVLTDLASSAWRTGGPIANLELIDQAELGIATFLLQLTPEIPRDVGVVQAGPQAGPIVPDQTTQIEAVLRNSGPTAESRSVEFLLDGERRDKMASVEFAPGSEQTLRFQTPPNLRPGIHQGTIRIVDGEDPMAFNDNRTFSFRVESARNVIVGGETRNDVRVIRNVLDPTARPTDLARLYVVEELIGREAVERRIRRGLDGVDAIFLNDLRQLDAAAWNALRLYVQRGGGIVIGLGPKTDPPTYNNDVVSALLPGELLSPVTPQDRVAPTEFDTTHPLIDGTPREFRASLAGDNTAPIQTYMGFRPEDSARVVIRASDGAPLLIERVFQGPRTGRTLLWTTPLSRDAADPDTWNDLPLFWGFFYLLYDRMMPYLARSNSDRLNFEMGQRVVLDLEPNTPSDFLLVSPEGSASPLAAERGSGSLDVGVPQLSGNWSVMEADAADQDAGGPNRPNLGFSVNPPAAESRLTTLDEPTLATLFGSPDNYALAGVAQDAEQLDEVVRTARVGRELFPWLMLIVLLVITAENTLANRFHREARTGQESSRPRASAA